MNDFAAIRAQIENSDFYEALEAMKAFAKEEELTQISILNRERKEIDNQAIANVASRETIRQEYNGLSMRMLNLLTELEREAEANARRAVATASATAAKVTDAKTAAQTTGGGSTPKWSYLLLGAAVLLLLGWGVTRGFTGGEEVVTPQPAEPVVEEQPKPKTDGEKAVTSGNDRSIYESLTFGGDGKLPDPYLRDGQYVDLLLAVYAGRPNDTKETTFSQELSDKVSKEVRRITNLTTSSFELTETFHRSEKRRLWTTVKTNLSIDWKTTQARYLLLADWRVAEDNSEGFILFSIYNLREGKRLWYERKNTHDSALRYDQAKLLANAVKKYTQ